MVHEIEYGRLYSSLFKTVEFDNASLEFEYVGVLRRIDHCIELSEKSDDNKEDLVVKSTCQQNYELFKHRKEAISSGKSIHGYFKQLKNNRATGDDGSEIDSKILEEVKTSKAAGLQIHLLLNIWIHDAGLKDLTTSSIRQSGPAKKSILGKAFNRMLGMTLAQQVSARNFSVHLTQMTIIIMFLSQSYFREL